MTFTPSFEIEIERILVDDTNRQRKELTKIDELAESIRRIGVLNPVILDSEHRLIAGRRRLEACRQLGNRTIPARYYESLYPAEQRLVELDENLRRVDLPWQEQASAIAELHRLRVEMAPGAWEQKDTAEYAGLSTGQISIALLVTKGLESGDPKLQASTSMQTAAEYLRRKRQLAFDTAMSKETFNEYEQGRSGEAKTGVEALDEGARGMESSHREPGVEQLRDPSTLAQPFSIQCADFLTFAESYSGPKFNLIHCDFPYGLNFDSSTFASTESHESSYEDSKDLFWRLTTALLGNQDRLVLSSAHMIFWFSMNDYEELKDELESHGWFVVPHPLIWMKSDNAGIVSDYRRRPRHIYETAFLCSYGDRPIQSPKGDAYACGIARTTEGHISAKPEEMLRHFLSIIADSNSEIFDPTCGSGTSLRAARALGAVRGLGLEINPDTAQAAELKLRKTDEEI